jgi:hypothetical protein
MTYFIAKNILRLLLVYEYIDFGMPSAMRGLAIFSLSFK